MTVPIFAERQGQIHRKGKKPFTIDCDKESLAGAVSQRACVFCGSRVVLYPIADAVHLVHGPIGCAVYTWDIRGCLFACASLPKIEGITRPYVAVTTNEGVLVNQHLGEAKSIQIWEQRGDAFRLVSEREAPESGDGVRRWTALAKMLGDCRALLTSNIGETPETLLTEAGVKVAVMSGFIEEGLAAIYQGREVNVLKGRRKGCAEGGCKGAGGGCG